MTGTCIQANAILDTKHKQQNSNAAKAKIMMNSFCMVSASQASTIVSLINVLSHQQLKLDGQKPTYVGQL
jgi:hypothetical protein